MINGLRRKWTHYWFGSEQGSFSTSLGYIRAFIYLSILFSLFRFTPSSYADYFTNQVNVKLYQPIGIHQVFGHYLFPAGMYEFIRVIAYLFTFAGLVGLFTRASMLVSFISNMILVSIFYFYGSWSHGFNIVYLAQLSILFAPAGRAFSVDAYLRRHYSHKPFVQRYCNANGNATWGVKLAQITVALMFFNAAYFKWFNAPLNLGWVFSDNIRNLLYVRYLVCGFEVPGYLQYVAAHPFLWKLLAFGNMISQVLPIMACFAFRSPRLRLVLGSFFVFEVVGLGLFAQLWFWNWFPLMAVFVDWKYFTRKKIIEPQAVPTLPSKRVRWLIGGYLALSILVAFNPIYGLHEMLNPYPFTKFPMYANMVTPKPYSEHKVTEMAGTRYVVKEGTAIDSAASAYLQKYYFSNILINDINQRKEYLRLYLRRLKAKGYQPDTLRWERVIFSLSPYPKPLKATPVHRGLMGKIDGNGLVKTAFAHHNRTRSYPSIDVLTVGYSSAEIKLGYIEDFNPDIVPFSGYWNPAHTQFTINSQPPKGRVMLVVLIKDSAQVPVDIYFSEEAIF